MFDFIEGEITSPRPGQVTLRVGGVGYLVAVPLSTYDRLPPEGDVRLFTRLVPGPDQILLFGFLTVEEREIFMLLNTVRGVGPQLALKILSGMPVTDFARAVREGKKALLCSIPGVGRKTAERLILELKDALEHIAPPRGPAIDSAASDAVVALIKLGVSRGEAEKAVEKGRVALPPGAGAEEIIRECLRRGLV